jgi:peptide/nickel transport system permease protein
MITLLLGGFLSATLVRLAPGYGAGEEDLDSRLSGESRAALRQARGPEESLPRYYLRYLERLMHGDLGESLGTHESVRQLLADRFPETFATVTAGLAFAWTLGLGLALLAVASRCAVMQSAANLAAAVVICIPAAVLALLFVMARAPGRLAVGVIVFPKLYQYARNLLGRSFALPHVLTARAKGLTSLRILVWHVLPVSARPLLALAGVSVCTAFAAAIPVEVVCDLPGIGQLAWKAALSRDLGLLVNLTMLVTLIALAANAAADLLGQPTRTERS